MLEIGRPSADEQKKITDTWKQVQAKTGVHVGTTPQPSFSAMLRGDPIFVGVNNKTGDVGYSPGILRYMTTDAISGIFAHELGHVGLPSHQLDSEKKADEFAARHGYGEQFIEALETGDKLLAANTQYETIPDDIHPETSDRIAAIRAAESQAHLTK